MALAFWVGVMGSWVRWCFWSCLMMWPTVSGEVSWVADGVAMGFKWVSNGVAVGLRCVWNGSYRVHGG